MAQSWNSSTREAHKVQDHTLVCNKTISKTRKTGNIYTETFQTIYLLESKRYGVKNLNERKEKLSENQWDGQRTLLEQPETRA